ncbi:LysR family transcriptional regulator [Pigmentiphaga sp. GD03639]|uniref:LysR family transcriptional regulator n=1 Tax=Pigmentiphaga sp. GD03639 TaxID=2975354 RepID=UPI0024473A15|nr:LysR family transcriptional regulator [Pigmentiphaga sp. GD03639]MDH2235030.1 LysR family transcriptional regulator [Pigmentiphaga sp. GD03639]
MQIPAYRYFLAVAETGSIRRAAELMHLSPSAISRQVQLLEHAFRSPLFERNQTGMILTEEGRIVAAQMRNSLRDMELARARIDELHGLVRGNVGLASIEGVMTGWLLPAISRFRASHPGITFDARVAGSEQVLRLVHDGTVDLGIALAPDEHDPDLEIVHRFVTRYVVAVAPDHALARRRRVDLKTLLAQPLALLDANFETRRWLNQAATRRQLPLTAVLNLDHIESIKRAVRGGELTTVLPDYAVTTDAAAGELVMIELEGASAARTATVLCCRRGRVQTRAARAVIDLLAGCAPA